MNRFVSKLETIFVKGIYRHMTTPFIISLSILDLIYSSFILPIYALRFGNR